MENLFILVGLIEVAKTEQRTTVPGGRVASLMGQVNTLFVVLFIAAILLENTQGFKDVNTGEDVFCFRFLTE